MKCASDDGMERLGIVHDIETGSGRDDTPELRAACRAYVRVASGWRDSARRPFTL